MPVLFGTPAARPSIRPLRGLLRMRKSNKSSSRVGAQRRIEGRARSGRSPKPSCPDLFRAPTCGGLPWGSAAWMAGTSPAMTRGEAGASFDTPACGGLLRMRVGLGCPTPSSRVGARRRIEGRARPGRFPKPSCPDLFRASTCGGLPWGSAAWMAGTSPAVTRGETGASFDTPACGGLLRMRVGSGCPTPSSRVGAQRRIEGRREAKDRAEG